jgi:hypothetical protein
MNGIFLNEKKKVSFRENFLAHLAHSKNNIIVFF